MDIGELRRSYHTDICGQILGYRNGVLSNADRGSKTSVAIAEEMFAYMNMSPCANPPAEQTIGTRFANITMDFLDRSFQILGHIRPGPWEFSASQRKPGIARFDQYEHLTLLEEVIANMTEKSVAAAIQGDYLVKPDITISRRPLDDKTINSGSVVIPSKSSAAGLTPMRNANDPKPTLHASVSCKWTMRSDRAQNSRTEALNLIRNRKGKSPHIVAVTAEPMPARLASLALGTGDIDCVYHIALTELMGAVDAIENLDQGEVLDTLVEGKRLRDISDLPFDLTL